MNLSITDFDRLTTGIEIHLSRAQFVYGEIVSEYENNPETREAWRLKRALDRCARRADIVGDYLSILCDEVQELRKLIDDEYAKLEGGQAQ